MISTRGIPRVHCYADALNAWRNAVPWRGEDPNVRKLVNTSQRHKTVTRRGDVISFGLYNTEVVTYHPDGEIAIEPYSTMSTSAFAHALTPTCINPTFPVLRIHTRRPERDDGWREWWRTARYYQAYRPMRLRPIDGPYAYEVLNPDPWLVSHVNPERAKAAYAKWGYDVFRNAAAGYFGLLGHWGRTFTVPRNSTFVLESMRDRQWKNFVTEPQDYRRAAYEGGPPYTLSTLMTKLRQEVRTVEDANDIERCPFVTGDSAWRRVK
jgi:hypothetical protein